MSLGAGAWRILYASLAAECAWRVQPVNRRRARSLVAIAESDSACAIGFGNHFMVTGWCLRGRSDRRDAR